MMDSAKGVDNSLKDVVVRDIAEIVAENIE
jgi:hypothetical protein